MSTPAASLFARVAGLGLPQGHYAILWSGPLIVRGWVEPSNDLDILCRGPAWEQALRFGDLVHLEDWDVDIVEVDEGAITIGRRWAIGDFDVDDLIDTAELIEGLPSSIFDRSPTTNESPTAPRTAGTSRSWSAAAGRGDDASSGRERMAVCGVGPSPGVASLSPKMIGEHDAPDGGPSTPE